MKLAVSKWRSLLSLRGRQVRKVMFRQRLRACAGRFCFERLEGRRMLASISDGGSTTLNIELAANESLSIVSNGSSYKFTSSQTFNNAGVAAANDFSAFGGNELTVQGSGLGRYSTFQITDTAAGAKVRFANSGINSYSDNIKVVLNSGSTGAVEFDGGTSFLTTNSFEVSTDADIVVNIGAHIAMIDGKISLSANRDITLFGRVDQTPTASLSVPKIFKADADGNGSGTFATVSNSKNLTEFPMLTSELTPSTGFGNSISVSADAKVVVIGASRSSVGSNANQGFASIIGRDRFGVTNFIQQLTASDGTAFDAFGTAVAISSDGSTVIVGAPLDDVGTNSNQGSATVFVRSASNSDVWVEQQRLVAINGAANDLFGSAVSISSDGNVAIVGAPSSDVGGNIDVGAATVFVRSSGVWTVQQQLVGNGGSFGSAVSITPFGASSVIVGADRETIGGNVDQGSATVFQRTGTTWTKQQQIVLAGGAVGDRFGSAVAIDNSIALIGASGDTVNGVDQGSATFFERSGSVWTQKQQLIGANGRSGDSFGSSVALGTSFVLIGAPFADVGSNANQGAATLFIQTGTTWNAKQRLTATAGAADDNFGASVALGGSGFVAFAGASSDDLSTVDAGSVQVFSLARGEIYDPTGDVEISAADVDLGDTAGSVRARSAFISVNEDGRPINLGEDNTGRLAISNSDMNSIRANSITIGNAKNGPITVRDAIANYSSDYSGFPVALTLTTSQNITVEQSLDSGGGSISLLTREGVVLNNTVTSSGGDITIQADSDANDVGNLVLQAPALSTSYSEQTILRPTDHWGLDGFGSSVSISADGTTAIVGAPLGNQITGRRLGYATVFVRSGQIWIEQQRLVPDEVDLFDKFGAAVAISADGNTVVVGAYNDTIGSFVGQGSARVFVRSGNVWTQQAKLTASAGAAREGFGNAVSISADGNTVLVGADRADVGSNVDQGSATIFVRLFGSWSQQAQLIGSGGSAGDAFGTSVALSPDGNTAIIGAPLDDVGANLDQGSAHIYVRSGVTWFLRQQLTVAGDAEDYFGRSVSLGANLALVGADGDDIGSNLNQGSAFTFARSGLTWNQQQQLTSASGAANDGFGRSVSLSSDGLTSVVGAWQRDLNGVSDVGAATIYKRSGSTWTEKQQLFGSGRRSSANTGFATAVNADGSTAILGAPGDGWQYTGRARVFGLTSSGGMLTSQGGAIAISASDVDMQAAIYRASSVSITAARSGKPIELGTNATGALGLTEAELDRIETQSLNIGDSNSGAISISDAFSRLSRTNLNLVTGKFISSTKGIESSGGNVSLVANDAITIGGIITSSGGDVTINSDANADGAGTLGFTPAAMDSWTERSTLLASAGVTGDGFGSAVALSADGLTALVGAYSDSVNNSGQGSATVFTKTSGAWVQEKFLFTTTGSTNASFGISVALSADGNTALIGAPLDSVGSKLFQGTASVFVRTDGVWTQQAQLFESGGLAGDGFGTSVSLSADGNIAVVGAYSDDVGTNTNQGSAAVFVRVNGVWTQQQLLTATSGSANDYFGRSVTINSDGDTILVGAYADVVGTNSYQGSATVFVRVGTTWVEQQQLLATGGSFFEAFGTSVDLSADGNTAIIGAEWYLSNQGFASVFVRSGGVWTEQQRLTATGGESGDSFGRSVALSADGNIAIVGSTADNVGSNANQGSATVFVRSGSTWTEVKKLTAADGAPDDSFGEAVAISANGSTALIGAYFDDIGTSTDRGSARIFDLANPGGGIASDTGIIRLLAADADIQGPITSANNIFIDTAQSGRTIDLGNNTAGTLGLVDAELDKILSPDLTTVLLNVGSASGGTISISAPITRIVSTNTKLTAGNTRNINFTGAGSYNSANGDVELTTTGTGAIRSGSATTDLLAGKGRITVLSGAGGIGTNDDPFFVAGTKISAYSGNADQFIGVTGAINIDDALNAGSGKLALYGGTFLQTKNHQIHNATALIVNGATFDIGTFSETVNSLTLVNGSVTGLTGILDSTSTISTQNGSVSAILNGSNGLTQSTGGNTTLTRNNLYSGPTTVSAGTLRLANSASNNIISNVNVIDVLSGATLNTAGLVNGTLVLTPTQFLKGTGTVVGGVTASNGSRIAPGAGTGVLNTGNLTLNSGATLEIEINGVDAPLFDQLNVNGVVSLGNATLALSFGFTPKVGDAFRIINNDGIDPVIGAFAGLPEGTMTTIGNRRYKITYRGGDGNDVVLDFIGDLILTISPASMSEKNGSLTAVLTRALTDNSLPLSITLASSDSTEATVPATVTIPANSDSVSFQILAVDDNLLDGTKSVTISASNSNFTGDAETIQVTDSESLSLTIDPNSIDERGSAIGTVTRSNVDTSMPIAVSLTNSDTSEIELPALVNIPANQASVSFPINGVIDNLLDGTQLVSISANSVGYFGDSKTIEVRDAETLSMTFDSASIGENGGALRGVLSRSNTNNSSPLTVSLSSSDLTEATVPSSIVIPANQSSVVFFLSAVDDNLLDGPQQVNVIASAVGYLDGRRAITITDAETVSVTIDPSGISEFGGTAIGTVTRSNTDIGLPIIVNLVNSDSTELSMPATVTIPANQASASFAVTAVDDSLLDGSQTPTIGANSAGYFGSSTSITITDYETIAVTFDKSSIAENGETAIATVTRSNTDLAAAVTLTLSNSDLSEIAIPTTITIPSNQTSTSFTITAVDDTLLDGTQAVTLSASATGYLSGSKSIDVTDVELLFLTIDKSRIGEDGGTATGTVVRGNSDIGLSITVNLTSSDTTEATVPATVTIAANQSSATFTITGLTDNLLDGTQSVAIIAGSPGYFSDLESIDVTDAETVSVNFDRVSISESGGTATGTVTRSNTDIAQALVVTLAGNDPSEATVPASVTIPAGQASTTFAVTAVDDNLLDGNQLVTITASAARYLSRSNTIAITDFEALSIIINATSVSENSGVTTGRVTRSNTDIALPLVVTLASNDTSETIVPTAVTIPANQSFVSFTITSVDDSLLDGSQSVLISADASGYVGASGSLQVTDSELLTIAINMSAISESGGSAIGTVSRSNTDNTQPLTIALSSNLASEATVPATVTIPAGAASIAFPIVAVDDGILDGTKTVIITANAAGYFGGSRTIDVSDSVFLSLDFAASSISENGGITSATVTRSNTNLNLPLTVQLLSSDSTEAIVPVTVTIPANQSSTTFTITAVDDTLLDGTQAVSISANAAGYISGNGNLDVTDAESLSISISLSSISENGGATTGTVTRSNSDTSQPLIVALLSTDTSEVDVPGTVTIPANQSSATFPILAVDDTLLDGMQTVVITGSAAGYVEGTQSIDVSDFESLSVSIDSASISELGGLASGTVTRGNTDLNQPLVVTLQSNDTSEATVPVTVTIPADQASATFAISAVDDALLDGSQIVAISASAIGYSNGSQTMNVADFETVSIVFSLSTISENGGTTTATITRSNTNTSQPITVALHSTDSTEASVPTTVVIPANQSSVAFLVSSVDDTLLDGTQTVTVVASAAGYVAGNQELLVSDAETLAVSLDATSISENGGIANGTVTRSNTDFSSPLTISLTSSDTTEASVPLTVTIPANESSTHFVVAGMDDTLLDGSQSMTVIATSPGYADAIRSLTVLDAEFLSMSFSVGSMRENGGTATGTLTRSNTDISLPLVVTLASDDTSEATVPATVTIAANQSSATFVATSVDDTLLDGTRSVNIVAAAAGYSNATGALDVTDAESLAISINPSTISESGGTTTATITRSNSDNSLPLTINLQNTDPSEVSTPSTITIPANQTSAVLTITAVDDDLLDGLQTATITAGSVGYTSAEGHIEVADAESISLVISDPSISESGGKANGIVTRSNTNIELPLIVNLQSSDLTEASVPTSVTIPANASSIAFEISAVDDALLDGTQAVSIQVSAANYAGSTAGLSVTDSESLTFTVDVGSISEKNGVAVGTVSRSNTDTAQPLVVLLVSDDTSEAIVPASVTIPVNQSEVTFSIRSVNDSLIDGNQNVRLTANAVDYNGSSALLIVRDDDPNFPWQNPRNRFDVNNDTLVSPIDALLVINALNVRLELTPELPNPFIPVRYVDVSGDGLLSPIDALLVINELNRLRASGEGENASLAQQLPFNPQDPQWDATIDLLAEDQLMKRRRSRLTI